MFWSYGFVVWLKHFSDMVRCSRREMLIYVLSVNGFWETDMENILDMVNDIQGKARTRKTEPVHYVVFNDEFLEIDGKRIKLNTEGWNIVTQAFGTASGSLIAKRLVAYLIRLKQKQTRKT